tara:strand:- start:821 stop:1510 length:690 start_codon:yes stop_codon:yes gene_type:complete
MSKKQNIKTEIKLSLRSGGEIDDNYIDFRINECMKKIFVEAQLISLSRYINPTDGLKVQPLEIDGTKVVLNNAPSGSSYVRHTNLYEITWDTDAISTTADYVVENVKSRKLISPSKYYIGLGKANDSDQSIIFYEDYEFTESFSLELWSFYSSTQESHIKDSFSIDFCDALLADVKYYFLSQQGRPWADPNLAQLELAKYREALRKLKINSNKEFTRRETKAKPLNGFI